MVRLLTSVLAFVLAAASSGCAFSTTAKNWNGLSGLDGKPTYYMSTTKIGLNLLIFIPFAGDMGITGLTRDLTADIKAQGGDQIRIVQGDSENYFYGWPPFTWIVSPIVSTVAAEYYPSLEQYFNDKPAVDEENEEGFEGRWFMPWTW